MIMNQVPADTLTFITEAVVEHIVAKFQLDEFAALEKFLHSKTYDLLIDEENKIWHLSPLAICDIFDVEAKTGNPLDSAYLRGDA
ncbi:MAG: hypothetical protein LBN34_04235 [Clostridiales Family XIII bacterium]|jgi:hypothetical protein|nr:hypothetical protein [Clostridiales Family XIII bacterium]